MFNVAFSCVEGEMQSFEMLKHSTFIAISLLFS